MCRDAYGLMRKRCFCWAVSDVTPFDEVLVLIAAIQLEHEVVDYKYNDERN